MIAYLQKSEGSKGFHQIIDFLNASHIQYALIENPTIYVSFIKQFWRTATARTSATGEVELTDTIDGQEKTITKASLRRHLKLEDNGGVTTLPNSEIFEQLALIGYATDSHKLTFQKEQFSSNIATAIICLATTRTFNFSKFIFDAMGRSLIEELDLDAEISLVPPHDAVILEKISDDTEEVVKGNKRVTTTDTALNTASVPISTTSATPEVSTTAANLVYIRRSAEKRKDKGKAIMIEDESVQKKSKKQIEQERLSHEEAIRLQQQVDEDDRKRIARDAEIAKQLQEEYDKAGKKEAVAEVDTAHVIDWNDPSVIRVSLHFKNRPRSVAEVRKNMLMYLKNQGGYKMKDFKGISYDDIRPIFEKYGIKFIHLCLWILKKKFKD
ncbi:hypothetical protein Tco_1105810 [Tanacetum coccineum]